MALPKLRGMGLRARLFVVFCLISLFFGLFSAAVFINLERATLISKREAVVRQAVESFLAHDGDRPRPEGTKRFAWRESGDEWRGDTTLGALAVQNARQDMPETGGILFKGGHRGVIWKAEVDLAYEQSILDSTGRLTLFYLLLNSLILLLVMGFFLSRSVVSPIIRLSKNIRHVGDLDAFRPIEASRKDEIGQLTAAFNELMLRIQGAELSNRQYVESLQKAYARLELAQNRLIASEKLASMGRLSAGIAHEVGNPLSAILGYQRLMLAEESPAEQRELLEASIREAQRIDRIIRGLLSFARTREEKDRLADVDEFLHEMTGMLTTQALFSGVTLDLQIETGLPKIPTGAGRLEQVFVNLCINAADAMQGSGKIRITAAKEYTGVKIEVADTGPGIKEEEFPHLFEPFYTTKQTGTGTGLGLALSHQIVTALGGTIHAENAIQGGAVFTVILPAEGREALT